VPRHGLSTSSDLAPRLVSIAALAALAAGVASLALPAPMPTGGAATGGGATAAAVAGREPTPAATPPAGDTGAGGRATAFRDPRRPYLVGPIEPPAPSLGAVASAQQASEPAGARPVDSLEGYQWPLGHARLTLPFGPTAWGSRIVDGERFHDGIDLASFCGDRVLAAHDGVVLAAGRHFDRHLGWVGDLGPYFRRLEQKHLWLQLPIVVVIDDGNGYQHVRPLLDVVVEPGDVVRAGDLLGHEGMTGHARLCPLRLFSPDETRRSRSGPTSRADAPARLEIARIDPLLVSRPAGASTRSPSRRPTCPPRPDGGRHARPASPADRSRDPRPARHARRAAARRGRRPRRGHPGRRTVARHPRRPRGAALRHLPLPVRQRPGGHVGPLRWPRARVG
jgi:murein DD-endopeptidase MepM/ murein hydrolase activator NlpD